ncbi:MAG: methyltransferase domain-containing protein [Thaumarchaeota archaeon]|nr:MAG: methyltransferase domain-containing protein [Nitrososphaerota archaeon]
MLQLRGQTLLFIIGQEFHIRLELDEFLSSLPQSIVTGEAVSLPDNVVRRIFKFAKLKKSDVFYHLGCGEGNAVEIAAKEFGVKKSVGIELNKATAAKARKQIAGIKTAEIVNIDITKANISDATVLLFWFNDPEMVDAMKDRFKILGLHLA